MSFYRERKVAKTRKPHQCCSCLHTIPVGSPSLYYACLTSAYDGMFSGHHHPECRAAEVALNNLHDWRDGDEWLALHEAESDDLPWLKEEHPIAFANLGWVA